MPRDIRSKIVTPEELAQIAETARAQGKRLVHCHGVFDLVHPGHINYFERSHEFGDILYVGVLADKFVKKGPDRPRFPEQMRLAWVAALECVDFVVLNNEEEGPWHIMRIVRPHVYTKGVSEQAKLDDPNSPLHKDKTLIEELGGEIRFTPEVEIHSTDIFKSL
ncbi:adenylyltransferase/cytidyltransferase family protein [Patescibacteria group bacterium]|nr:adenylyltransferase/cytidyltransferase family protein [Patescibacteria group bacterium]